MELVVRQLFSWQENEQFITHLFLKELGVKASRRTVSDADLLSHKRYTLLFYRKVSPSRLQTYSGKTRAHNFSLHVKPRNPM